jgi:predicted nucleotide-binding protein
VSKKQSGSQSPVGQPTLVVSRDEASAKIRTQIAKGQTLAGSGINSENELQNAENQKDRWNSYNVELLKRLFDNPSIADEYCFVGLSVGYLNASLGQEINTFRESVNDHINRLESILDRLELIPSAAEKSAPYFSVANAAGGKKIFIGHGRSLVWLKLRLFLSEKLHLDCDEFNEESPAGIPTITRLQSMLDHAQFAFLVMTSEDAHADGTAHARENVVHEAGLFQGRLGFGRAIILLEEGCSEFSNIRGLGQIRFPKANIDAAFEQIREVLKRELVVS